MEFSSSSLVPRSGKSVQFWFFNFSLVAPPLPCCRPAQMAECGPPLIDKSRVDESRAVPERWPSGSRRTLGKRVYLNGYRGFESHSLRQCFPPKELAITTNSSH